MARMKEIEKGLNPQQKLFAELFVTDKEMFGNGVECYLEVYEVNRSKPNWYKTACSAASRLLSNVKVIAYIRELLSEDGFNDANVEKQHTFLINQFGDLGVKQRALADYYKLKGKYLPDRVQVEMLSIEAVKERLKNLKK